LSQNVFKEWIYKEQFVMGVLKKILGNAIASSVWLVRNTYDSHSLG
jgi:hypothetical protein